MKSTARKRERQRNRFERRVSEQQQFSGSKYLKRSGRFPEPNRWYGLNEMIQKQEKKPRTDHRWFWVLAFAILGVLAATILVGQHLFDSLDENSAKLRTYKVTRNVEPKTGEEVSLVFGVMDAPSYPQRHPRTDKLYNEAEKIKQTDPARAAALYNQCQLEYNKDMQGKTPAPDDVFHTSLHYAKMAECETVLGQYQKALKHADKAIVMWPREYTYRTRAVVFEKMGDRARAAEDNSAADRSARAERDGTENRDIVKIITRD
ncbi:MAG TPA: hypothetical protein V6C72_17135 [Chroococcales cyanobacterium]